MRSRSVAITFLAALTTAISLSLVLTPHATSGGWNAQSSKDGHEGKEGRDDRDGHDGGDDEKDKSDSRVQRGFDIAPVDLNVQGKNRDLVGLGSYLVNAVGSCNDCHTCPSFQPGHSPYQPGGDGKINKTNYLAGGVHFGPFTSANLTPDANGRPAGLTLEKFIHTIRTGEDPDKPGQLLQVMVWPILRNMTDRDLTAMYEYLRSIPHAEPGTACNGPGE